MSRAPVLADLDRMPPPAAGLQFASGHAALCLFEMGEGGPSAEVHVAVQPGLPVARQGAGAVHNVAFRVPDHAALTGWTARVSGFRVPNSREVVHFYFRSLCFREPGGNLFKLATDGPGFDADEPFETMGESQVSAALPRAPPRRY